METYSTLQEALNNCQEARLIYAKGKKRKTLYKINRDNAFTICRHERTQPWDCGCSWGCDCCNLYYECLDCKFFLQRIDIPYILVNEE